MGQVHTKQQQHGPRYQSPAHECQKQLRYKNTCLRDVKAARGLTAIYHAAANEDCAMMNEEPSFWMKKYDGRPENLRRLAVKRILDARQRTSREYPCTPRRPTR